jgi:hypothetical protein
MPYRTKDRVATLPQANIRLPLDAPESADGQRDSNAVELDLAQGGLGKVGFYPVIE